jgi:hypothetical protein
MLLAGPTLMLAWWASNIVELLFADAHRLQEAG